MSLLLQPEFADIDRHFANFIGRFGGDDTLVPLAAAMLSRSIREGNICLPLGTAPSHPGDAGVWEWPRATEWRSILANSKAVGGPEAQTPLVIDESNRLYLRRYWNYQQRLAVALREKAAGNRTGGRGKAGTQAGAIDAAVTNALTIISGGLGRVRLLRSCTSWRACFRNLGASASVWRWPHRPAKQQRGWKKPSEQGSKHLSAPMK